MFELIIYIILVIFVGTAAYAGFSAAPWLPSRKKDVNRMVKFANIQPGDNVYDLGCGDGRLLAAAKSLNQSVMFLV